MQPIHNNITSTVSDNEGHRQRSKVTKNELMVISHKLLHSQTYLVPRYNTINTSNDISFFDLDLRSRSQLKVKGHRGGGVCVL